MNTCSFIDSAKQESVNTILEMANHKVANGGRAQKLIVTGCLVERYRDEIRKNIPEVDAVLGTGELDSILAAAGIAPRTAPSPFQILNAVPALEVPRGLDITASPEAMSLDRSGGAQAQAEALGTHVEPGTRSLASNDQTCPWVKQQSMPRSTPTLIWSWVVRLPWKWSWHRAIFLPRRWPRAH